VLKALLHADQFAPGTNLKAWLYTILRNCYFNEVRRASRFSELGEGHAWESAHARDGGQLSKIELDELEGEISALPRVQQVAIALVAIEGESYEAAALKVGCASGTMKSRVSRARAALVEALKGTSPQNDLKHLDDAA
jgi:RNA polymerase sigma-70 factor (ECF subfamily)